MPVRSSRALIKKSKSMLTSLRTAPHADSCMCSRLTSAVISSAESAIILMSCPSQETRLSNHPSRRTSRSDELSVLAYSYCSQKAYEANERVMEWVVGL
jgi:hypothetical protein